jgi:hypothetical protein
MTMTPAQQRALLSDLAQDRFSPLDLSDYPALNEPPPERSRDDGRFAKDWRDTALSASATALRQFVQDPDVEALERVGAETGHEDFRAEVRDRRGETVADSFKRANPEYLPTDKNYNLILRTLAFNALPNADGDLRDIQADLIDAGFWTVPNLTATYRALQNEGMLEVAAGTARQLSSSERLKVMRMAQSGRTDAAIGDYLRYALDGEEPTLDMVTDPAYSPLCNEAVLYVFEAAEIDYSPTEERRAFLLRYAANRPLTIALLSQAWQLCKQHEASYARQEIISQVRPETQPPTEREIDALDDNQIDALYHASLKKYADQFRRRAPGVLA